MKHINVTYKQRLLLFFLAFSGFMFIISAGASLWALHFTANRVARHEQVWQQELLKNVKVEFDEQFKLAKGWLVRHLATNADVTAGRDLDNIFEYIQSAFPEVDVHFIADKHNNILYSTAELPPLSQMSHTVEYAADDHKQEADFYWSDDMMLACVPAAGADYRIGVGIRFCRLANHVSTVNNQLSTQFMEHTVKRTRLANIIYLGNAIFLLVGAVWAFLTTKRTLAKFNGDVENLEKTMNAIKNNSEIPQNSSSVCEIQQLHTVFSKTGESLTKHLDSLTAAADQQAQHELDLQLAGDIQRHMLPGTSFNDPRLSVAAAMIPAQTAAGDFYYWVEQEPDHWFFALGDVSGKGLGAAVFMARLRTLLHHAAAEYKLPSEILLAVNEKLEKRNLNCMFATVCAFTLNLNTRELVICNAGHPLPYLWRGGEVSPVNLAPGMVIGPMPLTKQVLKDQRFTLQLSDMLLLYTDGVTEAMNVNNEMFNDWRLREVVSRVFAPLPDKLIRQVNVAVSEFTAGAAQSDDITMLAVKFKM